MSGLEHLLGTAVHLGVLSSNYFSLGWFGVFIVVFFSCSNVFQVRVGRPDLRSAKLNRNYS